MNRLDSRQHQQITVVSHKWKTKNKQTETDTHIRKHTLVQRTHSVHKKNTLPKWKTIQMSSRKISCVDILWHKKSEETSAVVIPARWMSEKSLISFWSVGWMRVCECLVHFNPCTYFEHKMATTFSLFLSLGFSVWQANWWIWAFNSLFLFLV